MQAKRLEIIDFLRGFSIFTIVVMHLMGGYDGMGTLKKVLAFGGAGVHVFILCSGFGLYLSHLRKPLSYPQFLRRRFSKIWLPYAIAVGLWGLWALATKGLFPWRQAASHWLLYKMFSNELDTSLCYPYWFISTIIQFYLAWPLIVKLMRWRYGLAVCIGVSLAWSTLVGVLGYGEMRPWGSCFLQYLWEFCLGMWMAGKIANGNARTLSLADIKRWKWSWLLVGTVLGMGLTGLMGWKGGVLKLYNDIPSLFGYLFLALIVYKTGISFVNRFFSWASSFGYELYLIHSLTFVVIKSFLAERIPAYLLLPICLVAAYMLAYGYRRMVRRVNSLR